MTGNQWTLPRTRLLQQLKKHRGRPAFRGEEERRARVVAELRKARITGRSTRARWLGSGDRALLSVMLYSFARVSAVLGMRRQDYFGRGAGAG